jgi:heterodisulfide reductase subunit B
MKYAFFPGCAVHSSAPEYGMSCKAVSEVLGIELIEISEWNCCGSMDAIYAYDPALSISLAARNLSLANMMGMEIVTLCSACYFTLSRADKMLHEDARLAAKVKKILNDLKLNYTGESKVRHYIDILINDVGLEKISEKVKVPLKGLKIAPYYGCLLIRPPEIVNFDDPEHPNSIDRLVETLGAINVNYTDKTRCCGASLILTKEKIAMEMTKDLLLSAKEAGADCIITACPMCHFNLDAMQRDIETRFNVKINLPILYVTQIIGISLGLEPSKLGLEKNCVPPMKLFEHLKV